MILDLEKGRYVVAVSGGVDSMVLLDVLAKMPDIEIVVAHYDHGIRHDSLLDRQIVQSYAINNGLKFVYDEGNLGVDTSEAAARKARYEFLYKVRESSKARAIITAHHQDDLLETAIINMLRGTSRKGLSPLTNDSSLVRPLLHLKKSELIDIAKQNGVTWREDVTNTDVKYLRNYLRHKVIPKMTEKQKKELLSYIDNIKKTNLQIDEILVSLLHVQPAEDCLDKNWFINLPHSVSCEVMNEWLKKHNVSNVTKKLIIRLVNAVKTSENNRGIEIDSKYIIEINQKNIKILARQR